MLLPAILLGLLAGCAYSDPYGRQGYGNGYGDNGYNNGYGNDYGQNGYNNGHSDYNSGYNDSYRNNREYGYNRDNCWILCG